MLTAVVNNFSFFLKIIATVWVDDFIVIAQLYFLQ